MKIGYERYTDLNEASPLDNSIAPAQRRALLAAKCEKTFVDSDESYPAELDSAINQLSSGDVLVVTSFDRFNKPLKSLVDLIADLQAKGAGLQVLSKARHELALDAPPFWDSWSKTGQEVIAVFEDLRRSDKVLNTERATKSQKAAVAKGDTGGRPASIDKSAIERAKALIAEGMGVRAAAREVGVSQASLYRLGAAKPDIKKAP